jgi:hypothetical protein
MTGRRCSAGVRLGRGSRAESASGPGLSAIAERILGREHRALQHQGFAFLAVVKLDQISRDTSSDRRSLGRARRLFRALAPPWAPGTMRIRYR